MSASSTLDRTRDLLGDFISPRMLGGLLLGRAGSRLVLSAAPAVLRLGWDPAQVGLLAAVMGPFVVVGPLVSSGPEKATSKLLPRLARAQPMVARACLGTAVRFVALSAAWLMVVLFTTDTEATPTILAFCFTGLLGLNQTVLAVSRARGRPGVDLVSQAVVTVGLVTGVAVGLLTENLTSMLAVWVGTVVAANAVSASALGREILLSTVRPVVRRAALAQAVKLSAGDVIAAIAVTVVLMVTAALRTRAELADLYVCLGLLAILMAGLSLLLRVIQAPLSARFRDRSRRGETTAVEAWTMARFRWIAAYSMGLATVIAVLAPRQSELHLGITFATVVAVVPVLVVVATIHFLFENKDAAALRRTTGGAAVGLATTAALAAPLTVALAAPGALLAILAGDVVHLRWLRVDATRNAAR